MRRAGQVGTAVFLALIAAGAARIRGERPAADAPPPPAGIRRQGPSESKLSIHLIGTCTPGAREIIQAHPRVLKILGTDPAMLQVASDYKAGTRSGRVVLRIYTTDRYTQADDPVRSAGPHIRIGLRSIGGL